MTPPAPSFRVHVDPTNPGQFFACCALLELSARLPGNADAQGWFEDGDFCLASHHNLSDTLHAITRAELQSLDASDATACPIWIGEPFNLRLDWWKSADRRLSGLKLWSGQMKCLSIALAMQKAMRATTFVSLNLLNIEMVVHDANKPTKKVEPFYFDARRGPNAHPRDVGFSTDSLKMTTTASPAVEFLCLVGLQRCLPLPVKDISRLYDYFVWSKPVESTLLLAAVDGMLPNSTKYRFQSWFRTSREELKAFLKAKPQQLHYS